MIGYSLTVFARLAPLALFGERRHEVTWNRRFFGRIEAVINSYGRQDAKKILLMLRPLCVTIRQEMELTRGKTKEIVIGQPEVESRRRPAVLPRLSIVDYSACAGCGVSTFGSGSGSEASHVRSIAAAIFARFGNVISAVTSSSVIFGCALRQHA